jgi:hypothetical protein
MTSGSSSAMPLIKNGDHVTPHKPVTDVKDPGWDEIGCLFIGGSTAWRLPPAAHLMDADSVDAPTSREPLTCCCPPPRQLFR